jgi:hypothetical protein
MAITLDGTNGITTPEIVSSGGPLVVDSGAPDNSVVVNSSGNLKAVATIAVGNATPSTSGAGITFPGTVSASSDANTLDDYEEGTWTPVVADAVTAGNTGTYSLDSGSAVYTKIGNYVYLSAGIRSINTSGMTSGNTLYIRGFPFVVGKRTFGSVQVDNITFANILCVSSVVGASALSLLEANSGSGGASLTVSDVTSGSGNILFSLAYYV